MDPIIIEGRPDFKDSSFMYTYAKRFPRYVYSTSRNGCLVHEISRLRLKWYRIHYGYLERINRPTMIAETVCGMSKFLNTKAKACEIPTEDAVMCGRCQGGPATFGRNSNIGITKQEAHRRLGCVVQGL